MTLAANPPDLTWPTIEAMRAFFTEHPSPDDIASVLNSCGGSVPSFDGVAEKFQSSHINLGTSFTWAAEILIPLSEKGELHGIMGQGQTGSGSTQTGIFKNTDPGPDRLFFGAFSDGGNANSAIVQGSSDLADGVARNFIGSVGPAVAPAGDIHLYENGILDNAIVQINGTGFQGPGGTLADFTIGIDKANGAFYGLQTIGRVAWWIDYKLTADEAAEWQALEASCSNPFFGEGGSAELIRRRGLYLFDGGHR